MSWYGPGPARPAIPPMGFGQGMPPGGMVPWGPPGGMPPRPQYQAPAPQPHFEQRPKRVSSQDIENHHSISFSSGDSNRSCSDRLCGKHHRTSARLHGLQIYISTSNMNKIFNFSSPKVRHLLTTAGPVVSWKRVQGATGKLQVGGCGWPVYLSILEILTRTDHDY